MVFSSLEFIFIFLPIFIVIYSFIPNKLKNAAIFLGSVIFYSYGAIENPLYIVLFCTTIIFNYGAGRIISMNKKKVFLVIGLIFNFVWLIFFKYTDFIMENISFVFPNLSFPFKNLILPIGISFYTFQNVSYLIDVYREKVSPEMSLIKYGTYISMFPQLIAGPIVTYDVIKLQLSSHIQTLSKLDNGLRHFTIGLGYKVLLANRIGGLWQDINTIGFESISTPLAWMGVIAYSLQIYFDFYGYSLMAIGLGEMIGFKLPENFNYPYLSVTMSEFWRKWHITLGSWFREYVYIPLGGNRGGLIKTIRNLFIVWILTGIWHGAGWNFVLWGGVLFILIAIEKIWTAKFFNRHRIIGHLYMIFIIPLTWLIFAVTDLSQLYIYFQKLFPFIFNPPAAVFPNDYIKYGKLYGVIFLAGILCSTRIPEKIYKRLQNNIFTIIILLIIFWLSIYCLYIGMNDPFLYFRF